MSESDHAKSPSGAAGQPAAGGDPSMEDILASIRRILAEEETAPPGSPPPAPAPAPALAPADDTDEVLQLDASMMLQEPIEPQAAPPPDLAPPPDPEPPPAPAPVIAPALPFETLAPSSGLGLMGDVQAAAATTSVGSLLRTLTAERSAQVYSGGPTLEDIVRAELRPLLKQWLDAYLPDLVERLVRAEIERVVGRAVP
jgi:cell pole-organizing protein PopZ